MHVPHVLHASLLHILWNDGGGFDSQLQYISRQSSHLHYMEYGTLIFSGYIMPRPVSENVINLLDHISLPSIEEYPGNIIIVTLYIFDLLQRKDPSVVEMACPVAWTLCGLVASQFGDIDEKFENEETLVSEFIRSYFGFRHSFLGVVAAMVVIFPLLFAFLPLCIIDKDYQLPEKVKLVLLRMHADIRKFVIFVNYHQICFNKVFQYRYQLRPIRRGKPSNAFVSP